jgi:hypothetical protein
MHYGRVFLQVSRWYRSSSHVHVHVLRTTVIAKNVGMEKDRLGMIVPLSPLSCQYLGPHIPQKVKTCGIFRRSLALASRLGPRLGGSVPKGDKNNKLSDL